MFRPGVLLFTRPRDMCIAWRGRVRVQPGRSIASIEINHHDNLKSTKIVTMPRRISIPLRGPLVS
jgi:hypothetical protein